MTSGNCHKSLRELLITVFRDNIDKFEDIIENENGRAMMWLGSGIKILALSWEDESQPTAK
jgi:hypothetical protein